MLKRYNHRSSTAGASLIEFAIVLPVLLLLMMGTIELGLLYSQIFWSSTNAYEAGRTGAETNTEVGVGAMGVAFDNLRDIHLAGGNMRVRTDGEHMPFLDAETKYYPTPRTVVSSSRAEAISIFNYLPSAVHMRYEIPMLLKNQDVSADNLGQFANADTFYNCTGTPMAQPNTAPCNIELLPTPPVPPTIQGCFGGETAVSMADGSQKPIRSVVAGDMVLAFDEESGRQSPARVSKTIKKMVKGYLLINGSMRVTQKHRFYLSGNWVPAEKLKPGDRFLSVLGTQSEVKTIAPMMRNLLVHNLTVAQFHNYYAGGVLVHNTKQDDIDRFGGG